MTYKRFITMILAGAIAIAGLASAPARADAEDTAKIVAGLAGLAILGTIIANKNDKDDHVTQNHDYNYDGHKNPKWKRVGNGHNSKRKLPGKCRVYREGKHGPKYGYDRKCLRHNFSGFHDLPDHCVIKPKGYKGKIYRENCLSQYGYRVGNTKRYGKHNGKRYDPNYQNSK